MAGESHGIVGPIKMRNPGMLLDVIMDKHASYKQNVILIFK